MNIPQEELDGIGRLAEELRRRALGLPSAVNHAPREQAHVAALDVAQLAAALTVRLERAGAARPAGHPAPDLSAGTPLHLLSTARSRRFAELLQDAYDAACAVDEERGTEVYGPAVENILAGVQAEVYGPAGQD